VNAKGSEEDEDYNGKSTGRDSRWDKGKGKAKKKPQPRKSDRGRSVSKAPPEEPPMKSSRTKRTTGRPSAVFSATKRGKDGKASDTEGLDSEDSLHVNSLRQDSRKRKTDTSKESKGKARAPKGTPPRSKEYLDDEDMADDEPAPPLIAYSRKHSTAANNASVNNVSIAEDAQIASSSDADVSVPVKPKASKVYGKRANKSVPRVRDSDDEGEPAEAARASTLSLEPEKMRGSLPQQETTAPAAKVKANPGSDDRERSVSKGSVSNRSRRGTSPPYVVVIDNSAKKKRPPMPTKVPRVASKSKLVETIRKHSSSEASEDEDSDAPLTTTKKISPKKKALVGSVKSASKQKKPARIADSEEEEDEDEDLENSSKKDSPPAEASNTAKAVDTSTRKPLQEQKSILQPKDQNASTLTKAASTASIAEAKSTPKLVLKTNGVLADMKPIISSTGKRRLFYPANTPGTSST
jgi:hypothetical protein